MKLFGFSYNVTVLLHNKTQAVIVKVRWRKLVTTFTTGCFADPQKWSNQSAIPNTTHKVRDYVFTAHEINAIILDYRNAIEDYFLQCQASSNIPSKDAMKAYVDEYLSNLYKQIENEEANVTAPIMDLYGEFLDIKDNDKLWCQHTRYKYVQTMRHFIEACGAVEVESIDKNTMLDFRNWLLKNDYKNITIAKHFRNLRSFLRWLDSEGYNIPKSALNYKENITLRQKRVLYLKYDELMSFYNFSFNGVGQNYLERARDLFCFMAFTSLRYSDLANLKKANVIDGTLQIYTEKTDAMLTIPLVTQAREILKKYAHDTEDEYMFRVPTNQKLNEYIKIAAQVVGLDRTVIDVQFSGNKRTENVSRICDVLTCHVARKTFVTTSIQLGIPQSVVMKCTGHSDFRAMKPYVGVADETTKSEMLKWDRQSDRVLVTSLIEHADEVQLRKLVSMLKGQ